MKSQFKSIRFIKEKEVQKIQMQMASLNSKIKEFKKEISIQKDMLLGSVFPKSGSFKQVVLHKEIQQTYRHKIAQLKIKLQNTVNDYEKVKIVFKKLNIEFEKFKYLEKIEQEKIDKELKKKELKMLDELATITTFYRN